MKTWIRVAGLCLPLLLVFAAGGALAGEAGGNPKNHNVPKDGLVAQGYDVVSYILDGKAAKGSKDLSATHAGLTYRFATPEHKAAFQSEPARFLPAYGGWCATAMADGDKVSIDPENFKVTEGRLFLFYRGILGNAKKRWDADEKALTAKADAHWKTIGKE